jgi:hypothetical protein
LKEKVEVSFEKVDYTETMDFWESWVLLQHDVDIVLPSTEGYPATKSNLDELSEAHWVREGLGVRLYSVQGVGPMVKWRSFPSIDQTRLADHPLRCWLIWVEMFEHGGEQKMSKSREFGLGHDTTEPAACRACCVKSQSVHYNAVAAWGYRSGAENSRL